MSVNSPVTSNEIKGFFPPGIVTGLGIIVAAFVVAWSSHQYLPYNNEANKGLALLIFVAILWFTEAVHISLTAIMIPIGALLLHIPEKMNPDGTFAKAMSMKAALAGFADPIIYLFLGGFALYRRSIRRSPASLSRRRDRVCCGLPSASASSPLSCQCGFPTLRRQR